MFGKGLWCSKGAWVGWCGVVKGVWEGFVFYLRGLGWLVRSGGVCLGRTGIAAQAGALADWCFSGAEYVGRVIM